MYFAVLARLRVQRHRWRRGLSLGPGVRLGRGVVFAIGQGGQIRVGARCEIGNGTILQANGGRILVEDDVFISGNCLFVSTLGIRIGKESMIAEHVTIRDHDHDPDTPPRMGILLAEEVSIGERCWLGSRSSVLRRGRLGDDGILGAHALLCREIPPKTLAAGVPATVRRRLQR